MFGVDHNEMMRLYREAAMQHQRRMMSDAMGGLGDALGAYGGMGSPNIKFKPSPQSYREELQAEIDEWLK